MSNPLQSNLFWQTGAENITTAEVPDRTSHIAAIQKAHSDQVLLVTEHPGDSRRCFVHVCKVSLHLTYTIPDQDLVPPLQNHDPEMAFGH